MATMTWPGGAIGECMRYGMNPGDFTMKASHTLPCRGVLGVVKDARRRSVQPEQLMQTYVPDPQLPDILLESGSISAVMAGRLLAPLLFETEVAARRCLPRLATTAILAGVVPALRAGNADRPERRASRRIEAISRQKYG